MCDSRGPHQNRHDREEDDSYSRCQQVYNSFPKWAARSEYAVTAPELRRVEFVYSVSVKIGILKWTLQKKKHHNNAQRKDTLWVDIDARSRRCYIHHDVGLYKERIAIATPNYCHIWVRRKKNNMEGNVGHIKLVDSELRNLFFFFTIEGERTEYGISFPKRTQTDRNRLISPIDNTRGICIGSICIGEPVVFLVILSFRLFVFPSFSARRSCCYSSS